MRTRVVSFFSTVTETCVFYHFKKMCNRICARADGTSNSLRTTRLKKYVKYSVYFNPVEEWSTYDT